MAARFSGAARRTVIRLPSISHFRLQIADCQHVYAICNLQSIQWNRGELNPDLLFAIQASSPLDDDPILPVRNAECCFARHSELGILHSALRIKPVTEVGVEPTQLRLSTRWLYQLAYSVDQLRRPRLELGDQAYETRLSTCPPASCRPGS